jgi:hypothetical protein
MNTEVIVFSVSSVIDQLCYLWLTIRVPVAYRGASVAFLRALRRRT